MAIDAGTGFKFPSTHPKAELVHKRPVFFVMVLNPFANTETGLH
jgi:hypothetical protein